LCIRPIYHQKDSRIEAHIFVAFGSCQDSCRFFSSSL
jgi:hypothetical protein